MARYAPRIWVLFLVIMLPGVTIGADYYVNLNVGSDSNNGLSPQQAWRSISKVNNSSFQPGDTIHFRKGQIWRERLIPPSSGTAANPIVFTSYGTGDRPGISGAVTVTGWQLVQGTVYRAPLSNDPSQTFENFTRLTENEGAVQNVGLGEWDWDAGNIYLNVGHNPSNSDVEVTYTVHGIFVQDVSHVTFDGLHITRARVNIYVTGDSHGSHSITIKNCRISDAYFHGIQGWDQSLPNNDITIHNNEIVNSGGSGINWTKFGDGGVISHNTVLNNGRIARGGEHAYTAGISIFGNKIGIENIIIENNVVGGHSANAPVGFSGGVGIWVDQTLGGNIVRYNVVYGNRTNGVVAEDTPLGGAIYYNVVYGNGWNGGYGINLMRDSWNWDVYNNTVYDNGVGVVLADWIGDGVPDNVTMKNNIIFNNDVRELMVLHGAETNNNVFQFNNLEEGPGFVRWGTNTYYDTVAQWEAATGARVEDNMGVDPMFTSPPSDFRLRIGSPCAHAGADVGLTEDILGHPVSSNPSMGAYENPVDVIFSDGFESGDTSPWSHSW